MLLNAKRGDRGRLFNANGVEIGSPVEANTETGEVWKHQRDENGHITVMNGDVPLVKFQYASPLRLERK